MDFVGRWRLLHVTLTNNWWQAAGVAWASSNCGRLGWCGQAQIDKGSWWREPIMTNKHESSASHALPTDGLAKIFSCLLPLSDVLARRQWHGCWIARIKQGDRGGWRGRGLNKASQRSGEEGDRAGVLRRPTCRRQSECGQTTTIIHHQLHFL